MSSLCTIAIAEIAFVFKSCNEAGGERLPERAFPRRAFRTWRTQFVSVQVLKITKFSVKLEEFINLKASSMVY